MAAEWRERKGLRFRLLAYVVIAAASVAAAVIYSNAEVSVEPAQAAVARSEERTSLIASNVKRRRQAAQRVAIYSSCRSEIGPLLSSLQRLNSRLDVGLNFEAYSQAVGDASVKYNQIAFRRLHLDCTSGPGVAAESAFNAYVRAYNTWNDCIGELYCSTDSIEPQLQANWSTATRQISRARRALNGLLI
jgi:hypothetical protein